MELMMHMNMTDSKRMWCCLGIAWLVGGLAVPAAFAVPQVAKPTEEASRGGDGEELIDLDRILDQAVRNLAMRYNLNAEQMRYTNDLMHTRVKKFIQAHQKEAWPVLRELMRYQLKAETPDGDAAKRIAEAALPLFEEAKKAILDANNEWRDHLSDEQKKLHDFDLKEMNGTFQFVQQNLGVWKDGKPQSSSLFPAPPPKRLPNEPPTPPRPPEEMIRPIEEGVTSRDMFTAYVDGFIRDYGLDSAQASSARAIQKEIMEKAAAYQKSHEQDLARCAAAIREAIKQGDSAKQKELEAQHQRLLEPVQTYFDDMVDRLVGLLTVDQKQKFMKNNPTWGQPRPATGSSSTAAKPGAAGAGQSAGAGGTGQPGDKSAPVGETKPDASASKATDSKPADSKPADNSADAKKKKKK